jgi:hypothetical protein
LRGVLRDGCGEDIVAAIDAKNFKNAAFIIVFRGQGLFSLTVCVPHSKNNSWRIQVAVHQNRAAPGQRPAISSGRKPRRSRLTYCRRRRVGLDRRVQEDHLKVGGCAARHRPRAISAVATAGSAILKLLADGLGAAAAGKFVDGPSPIVKIRPSIWLTALNRTVSRRFEAVWGPLARRLGVTVLP